MLRSLLKVKHFMFDDVGNGEMVINGMGGTAEVMEFIRHKFSPWGRPVSWVDFKEFSFAKVSKDSHQVGSYVITLETVEVNDGY